MNIFERKQNRQKILHELFVVSTGSRLVSVNLWQLAAKLQIAEDEMLPLTDFLAKEGLLKYTTVGNIALTHSGIKSMEENIRENSTQRISFFDANLAIRTSILIYLFENQWNSTRPYLEISEVEREILTSNEVSLENNLQYLIDEGLIESALPSGVSITHEGIKFAEAVLSNDQGALFAEHANQRKRAFLFKVYNLTEGKVSAPINGQKAGSDLGLTDEETAHLIEQLLREDLIVYANPMVLLTPKGISIAEKEVHEDNIPFDMILPTRMIDGHIGNASIPSASPLKMKGIRIFLCHSSLDKPTVRTLYSRLVSDGFNPWLDEENLLPGQDWDLEIKNAVRASDVVIVCVSKSSVTKSGYVQKEIKVALDVADEKPEGSIFVIPVKLAECVVPERLRKWQWVNYFESNGYDRLLLSLQQLNDKRKRKPL